MSTPATPEQRQDAERMAREIEQFGGPAYMNKVQDALLVRALRLFAQSERKRISDHQVQLWADRHSISGTITDIRAMFDDARSL